MTDVGYITPAWVGWVPMILFIAMLVLVAMIAIDENRPPAPDYGVCDICGARATHLVRSPGMYLARGCEKHRIRLPGPLDDMIEQED